MERKLFIIFICSFYVLRLTFYLSILHYKMTTQKCKSKIGTGKGERICAVLSLIYLIQIDGENSIHLGPCRIGLSGKFEDEEERLFVHNDPFEDGS